MPWNRFHFNSMQRGQDVSYPPAQSPRTWEILYRPCLRNELLKIIVNDLKKLTLDGTVGVL
jgi:hypothetical protein